MQLKPFLLDAWLDQYEHDMEAVARFVVCEGEDVVYGPGRSGARSEVEFYLR
jgi:hypothetical protein